jgi:hypothetical protein
MVLTLRMTNKGREALDACSHAPRYRFVSARLLRLYKTSSLQCPTGDPVTDRFIEALLKEGYLEPVPDEARRG